MVLCLVVNLLGGPEEAVSAYRRIGVSAFEVRCSKFEVPSSGCDRSNGAGPSTTEAYASRVDSVMHSRPANPKDYTRDAYATVPGDFRVSIAEAAQNPEL